MKKILRCDKADFPSEILKYTFHLQAGGRAKTAGGSSFGLLVLAFEEKHSLNVSIYSR